MITTIRQTAIHKEIRESWHESEIVSRFIMLVSAANLGRWWWTVTFCPLLQSHTPNRLISRIFEESKPSKSITASRGVRVAIMDAGELLKKCRSQISRSVKREHLCIFCRAGTARRFESASVASIRCPTMKITIIFLLLLSGISLAKGGTNEEGVEFLKANKAKEGVIELASGLQYKVLTNGTGVYHPLVGTPCSCHYQGQLIDGTVFDSSYERGSPTTFGRSN